jgi:EAL domain-containing protein (putative c-di-GMP-specific phosphodiesterase class I)
MTDQSHARITIEELLGRGFFAMVYQPIFKDPGAPPYGYEALQRGPAHSPLGSPQRVFHDPGYIPQDLMLRLDLACIGAAVRSGRRLAESAYLFINVHGRTLQGLASNDHHVYALIDSLHIDPSRIVLEVSESTPVKDIRELARHLTNLRRQGLRIALDDVGTGFPWLEYLIWLEPDFVKLDRHFVTGISQEEKKQKLVWELAGMVRRLGAQLVAEGVETADELETLRSMNIPLVQGHYLGRPLPAEAHLERIVAPMETEPPPAILMDGGVFNSTRILPRQGV